MANREFAATVGRVILYHFDRKVMDIDYRAGEPCPALVCAVNDDGSINIGGFDRSGKPFSQVNVSLLQPDAPKPTGGNYAEWMLYQVKVMERDKDEQYRAGLKTNESGQVEQTYKG